MKAKIERLPNGVTLAVIDDPSHKSVAAVVAVRVGSRDEPDGFRGAAHFIEHMRFKRTKAMPSPLAVSKFVESRGGEYNAWTEKEMTAFHVQMAGSDGKDAVGFLHEIVANGEFRRSDFDMEKQVILDEVTGYENDPDQLLYTRSDEQLFRGSGMAHPVPGSSDDVRKLSLSDIKSFYEAHYLPDRMVVVLSGDVKYPVYKAARAKFGSLKGASPVLRRSAPELSGRFLKFNAGKTDRMHVLVTFPGPSYQSPERRAAGVVSSVLGGMNASRLVQSLREKKGLCYHVGTHAYPGSDHGTLAIYTAVEPDKLDQTLKLAMREVKAMRESGPAEEEVRLAKAVFKGYVAINLDDPMSVASSAARGLAVRGTYESPEDSVRSTLRVKRSEAAQAAKKYLSLSDVGVTVVGPGFAGGLARAAVKKIMSEVE